MTGKKKVKVVFSKVTGKVKVQSFGFHGPSCMQETKFIEEALGKVTSVEKKKEFYETEVEIHNEITRGLCG